MKKNIIIINILVVIFGFITAIYGIDLAIQGKATLGIFMIALCDITIALASGFNLFMAKMGQI